MRPAVYITRKLPDSILQHLSGHVHIKMWDKENEPVPQEILQEEIREADGLLCLLTDQVDEKLLSGAPHLKIAANMAVGYNNIDVAAAAKRRIIVTNAPGVLTETTADLTFALLMAAAQRLVESSDFLRAGNWSAWTPMELTGQDIYGATLGIIGMGRIGQALARRAKGFNMRIVYHNRSRKPEVEKELGLDFYTDLYDMLPVCDYVCILVPYTSELHHFIGEKEMNAMKQTAVLINTARGGLVDEEALFTALSTGKLFAAGLDVFEKEPVNPDSPLLSLSNLVTLPHIGSASRATRLKMAKLAADNIIAVLSGKPPLTPV
ncbi:2-hydroxyacid dehydrogenase [Heyndrickxia acidicola]|uniref:D-glycerate dehydrogenase n=1 Tax=Heyndrickxia acidicola TaxID=209389 RepID=A0ABU6MFX3_9BACI|nr:D-glycerate dehydrogenase [Heyndrickxia acidicola]MED1203313.1 D-glycerate dehydrogenase [Heyndrickxia acidicola]